MVDLIEIAKRIAGIALPAAANVFLPGSGALAKQVIDAALGVTQTQTADDALAALEARPELVAQMRIKMLEHDAVMAEIGRAAAQDERQGALQTFQAEVGDRDSARKRETEVKDRTPSVLAYLTFAEVALTLLGLFLVKVPLENSSVLYLAVGAILGSQSTAFAYYFGSTQQSEKKTAQIATLAAEKFKGVASK